MSLLKRLLIRIHLCVIVWFIMQSSALTKVCFHFHFFIQQRLLISNKYLLYKKHINVLPKSPHQYYLILCQGITSVSLPITLMSDMFDCVTLDVCEELFHIVEKHVATWTAVS